MKTMSSAVEEIGPWQNEYHDERLIVFYDDNNRVRMIRPRRRKELPHFDR